MIIRQVQIENFQSHVNTTLDFHPNFNCIVGTGNVGKSSIVRALGCILYGQWEPSWVRFGATSAKISLTTDAGVKVIREKGEKVNKYTVQKPGEKDQVYENFGTQVPAEIEKEFQIFKAQIDAKEYINLNVSNQLDSMFLLAKPGSYRAKVIGKLSGAHYLDFTLRELNKDKKNLSAEKNVLEEEKLTLQTELTQYANLDQEQQWLDSIGSKLSDIEKQQAYVGSLQQLFSRVSRWKDSYLAFSDEDEKLAQINLVGFEELSALVDHLKALRKTALALEQLRVMEDNLERQLNTCTNERDMYTKQYTELLTAQQVCPTCYNEITETQVEKIKEQL